jgi:hypothetical protein
MNYADDLIKLRSIARVVTLIDAAHRAALTPISLTDFHTFAYLANVLSPVWSMKPFEARLLKLRGGPYYPVLQETIDELIGRSVLEIIEIDYVQAEDRTGWRLLGKLSPNQAYFQKTIQTLSIFQEERQLQVFVQELALALGIFTEEQIAAATTQDATYSDSRVDTNEVLNFAELSRRNSSAYAADILGRFERGSAQSNADMTASPGEQIHLYIQHMRGRLARI